MTSDDDMTMIHGSGNVFRDFDVPNPDLEQLRAILAAKIIGVLDDRKLTVRAAETLTGIAAAEFSRIRNVKLERFTLDRMIKILGKLDEDVEVSVTFHSRQQAWRTRRAACAVNPFFQAPARRSCGVLDGTVALAKNRPKRGGKVQ